MKLTIEIHDTWLGRPEDLRKILATIAGLEDPPTGTGPADRPHGPHGEPSGPEGRPAGPQWQVLGRRRPEPGQPDDDIDEEGEEDPPTDGRQLLGWCAKQVPDAKGKVIGYGKKRGFPGRVVDWKPDQVDAAYRFARARPSQSRR